MDLTPDLLAKVRLLKRREVYLVVDTDSERGTVEVISITGLVHHLISDVPLAAIREVVGGGPVDLSWDLARHLVMLAGRLSAYGLIIRYR